MGYICSSIFLLVWKVTMTINAHFIFLIHIAICAKVPAALTSSAMLPAGLQGHPGQHDSHYSYCKVALVSMTVTTVIARLPWPA